MDISIEFGLYPTESDLTELQQYFPDTNLKKLYEVEAYHKKLETILDSEFSTERESLIAEIDELESQLTTLNQELQELGNIPNLSSEYLESYSKLTATINALKEQNEAYLKESGLPKEKSGADADLKRSTEDILLDLEVKINSKMREFNCLLFIKSIFLLSISKKVTSCSFASRSPIDNPTYPMPTTVIFMLTSILKLFINQFFC